MFFQVMLPVLLIFLIGYTVQRWKRMNIRSISTVVIYILTPSLVFRTFYTADLNMQYLMMVLFALALLGALVLLNFIYVRLRKYPQSVESGLVLSTVFMNSGNYGAPILLFAYGKEAFTLSISLLVIHSVFMNFFGGYYANRSAKGIKSAFIAVFKLPSIYAAILALGFHFTGMKMPENIFSAIDLISSAAIPLVMLVLGFQLAEMKLTVLDWNKIIYGTIVRLVISPLIALALVSVLPVEPLLRKVLIVTSAMPSAVMAVIYAIQFEAEPELVSSITFVSTLLSFVTITIILVILG
ncbi:AEC family transporter [Ferviditalea candida]|uniref:AEC family transporter n=1 Tax=Ferviditalea candida TaxID=3108399 RepID=A0ABU5ZL46_9BACL|nr:AEC family transporter [Paenibacillaceae bacterium T2]